MRVAIVEAFDRAPMHCTLLDFLQKIVVLLFYIEPRAFLRVSRYYVEAVDQL
jgi:hypothetical protein